MSVGVRTLILAACTVAVFGTLGLSLFLGLRLQQPSRLVWLAVPALLVAAEYLHALWREAFLARLGPMASRHWQLRALPARQQLLSTLLLVIAATLLVIASARPQWGERPREVERRGIDVVFAVDLSRSMLATDIAPSRLEATVSELDRLMRTLRGDRVGLVVFAADAVKQSPLTSDYGAIRHYLGRVHPDHFRRQGTAIGRAIRAGTELLVGEGDEGFRRASNQLIVVLSDGEDTISDPIEAARAAREQGIRVYTVGVGTREGGPIPIRGRDDAILGHVEDRSGQVVITSLEEDQLREVAAAGDGSYRRYTNEGSISTFIEGSIRAFEAEALSSVLRAEYIDRFPLFLYPALLLLLLASLLRTELPHRLSRALSRGLTAGLLLTLGACDELPEREEPHVRSALEAWERGDPAEARVRMEQASPLARGLPAFAYNLALLDAHERLWESAQVRLLDAITTQEPGLRARALFALGNTLFERERWDEAIQRYRRVLDLNPEHAGARRNLEIALRHKFPPCSELDDAWEDNDHAADAPDLPASFYAGDFIPPEAPTPDGDSATSTSLTLCGGDPDWFALPLLGGARLTVEVTARRLREDTGSTPPPDRIEPMNVRIALLEYDGETVLAVDQGLETAEEDGRVPAARIQRSLVEIPIPEHVGVGATGFLKIDAAPDLEYTYSLRVTVDPPCWALEDSYEPNDLAETAHRIEGRDEQLEARLCPGNADWYRVDLPAGETLFVDTEPLVREDGELGRPRWSVFIDEPDEPVLTFAPTEEEPVRTWALDAESRDRTVWLRVTSDLEEDAGNYRASIHRYAPCPEGNDRYEPNDDPSNAWTLSDEGPGPFRHLRLCDGDVDWYAYALPPDPDAPETDATTPDPDPGEPPEPRLFTAVLQLRGSDQRARLRVLDPRDGRLIATSVAEREDLMWTPAGPPSAPAPDDPAAAEGTSSEADTATPPDPPLALGEYGPMTTHIAAFEAPHDLEGVVLVLEGDPAWYHLSFPEAEQMQQQQQEQEQQEQEQQNQQPPEDGDAGDDPDEASDPSEDEASEPQSPDDEEADENAPSPEPDEAEDEGSEDAAEASEDETEEERRERMLRLLDSLERDDVNLQIEQTLRDAPPERIDRPW